MRIVNQQPTDLLRFAIRIDDSPFYECRLLQLHELENFRSLLSL